MSEDNQGKDGTASRNSKGRSYSFAQIVRKLAPYFSSEKKRFALTLVFVGLKVSADVYLVLLSRAILTIAENFIKGTAGGPASSVGDIIAFSVFGKDQHLGTADLPVVCGLLGATVLIFMGVTYFRSLLPAIVISNVAFSVRRALYTHLQCMDLHFFGSTRCGDIASRLTNDIQQGVSTFGRTVTVLLYQMVLLVGSLYFMAQVNVPLTLAAVMVGALFLVNMKFLVPHLRSRSRMVQEKLGEINGEVSEKFGGIKVTQSFTNEGQELEHFTERIDDHRNSAISMARLASVGSSVGQSIPLLGSAVILGLGAYTVINGKLSLSDLTFFWMMRARLFSPFQMFTHLFQEVARGLGALDRIFEFFTTRSRVVDRPGAVRLNEPRGEVEFRNVSFSYALDRGRGVLSDFSCKVKPGMSVALVGASGAGKTTAVDLLSRFYDPTEGAIFVDGKDIRDYKLQSLRDNIGVVMQEPILFSGTIRENVRYGKPSAKCKEIREALKMANAWEFVSEMDEGMDTIIGERGASLSGGQRQRLSIARAFLKDPRILVLDEATSSLDSISEYFVQEALERLMKERTTFIIAHRLSTIARVDTILVLQQGRIIEQGTHAELLSRGGHYSSLYSRQVESLNSVAVGASSN